MDTPGGCPDAAPVRHRRHLTTALRRCTDALLAELRGRVGEGRLPVLRVGLEEAPRPWEGPRSRDRGFPGGVISDNDNGSDSDK